MPPNLKPYSSWIMAGPMLRLAFWALLGASLGFIFSHFEYWWGLACLALVIWKLARPRVKAWAIYVAIFCTFAASSSLERGVKHPLTEQYTRGPVLLQGRVCSEPIELRYGGDKGRRVMIPIKAKAFRFGAWQPTDLRVCVDYQFPEDFIFPKVGQELMVSGKPVWRDSPGMGIWKSSIRLYAGRGQVLQVGAPQRWGLLQVAMALREKLAQILDRGLEEYESQRLIMKALLLGYRSELPEELRTLFSDTGTMHVFAISGLHVGVIALLVIGVLRSLRIPMYRWAGFLFPVLLFFVVATGFKASALRAFIMAVMYWSAPMLRRRANGFAAWSAAAMLVLALAPGQLIDVGFQYSFIIVFGLMVLYPMLEAKVLPWLADDPYRLIGVRSWREWGFSGAEKVGQLFCISLAAWLCSIPLSCLFFNSFTWVAVPANLFVVPGTFLTVVSGILSMLGGLLHPNISEVFNHAARLVVTGMLGIIRLLEHAPASRVWLVAPPLALVVGYYVVLFSSCLRLLRGRLMLSSLLILSIYTAVILFRDWNASTAYYVDVDPGQGLVLKLPQGHGFLIDGGPSYRTYRVERALKRAGVNSLDGVYISHLDSHHYGALDSLLDTWPIERVYVPRTLGRSGKFEALLTKAEGFGTEIVWVDPGMQWRWAGGLSLDLLATGLEEAGQADDRTLVFRISAGRQSLLYLGGGGMQVEEALIHAPLDLASPVLCSGNPKAKGMLSEGFLNEVRPQWILLGGRAWSRAPARQDALTEKLKQHTVSLLEAEGGRSLVYPLSRDGEAPRIETAFRFF